MLPISPRKHQRSLYNQRKLLYFPLPVPASCTASFLAVSAVPLQAITWPSKESHFQCANGNPHTAARITQQSTAVLAILEGAPRVSHHHIT